MKTQNLTSNTKMILNKSNYKNFSFASEFADIIEYHAEGYNNEDEFLNNLKGFLEDLGKGGCISGIIGEFIYNSDCKDFYINHIDDLEEFKNNLEDNLGEKIQNRHDLPHYTFIVWLCFEEFAYDLYNTIFE